jgi:hypothetical protein
MNDINEVIRQGSIDYRAERDKKSPLQGHPAKGPKNGAEILRHPAAQDAEQAENLLREIALKLAQWEGVPVPPRRWFALNRIHTPSW